MQKLPDDLLKPSALNELLRSLQQSFSESIRHRIGYPDNFACNSDDLASFFRHAIVNVGDPFASTVHQVKTFAVEKRCIEWFARLHQLDTPWGYVTSCGSEANLHGAYIGRELYPEGQYYFSTESHPCMPKIAKILRMPHTEIRASPNGEMDYEDLALQIAETAGRPAIINLNIGTTFSGAMDSLERTVEVLERSKVPYYLHCDAALAGMFLPFIPEAPKLDFSKYPIGSIAISGHKFLGTPVPCSLLLVDRARAQSHIAFNLDNIGYLGSADTTVGGSRNGLAPLAIWSAICQRQNDFVDEVATCLRNAKLLFEGLARRGYDPVLHEFSTTVVFQAPPQAILEKWQLMVEGTRARAVVMQHVTSQVVDEFLADLPDLAESIRPSGPASEARSFAPERCKAIVLPLHEVLDLRVLDRFPGLAEFGAELGQTPLVEVPGPADGGRIYAKCEWLNPTGTVKDRTAFGFVYDIVKDRDLERARGVHVLECTGGNLAFALARLCTPIGITCTFVSVEGYLTDSEILTLQEHGHEILFVPKTAGFEGCLNHGVQLAAQHPDWIFLHQHENRDNLEVHRRFTGEEIARQFAALDLTPDAWAASVGTGGCLMGIHQALQSRFSEVELYVVSPAEKPYGSRATEAPDVPSYSGAGGYTCGRKQPFIEQDEDQVTGLIEISFDEATLCVAAFEQATGVTIGGSSAANWLAAHRIARELGPDSVTCTLFASASHTAIEHQKIASYSDREAEECLEKMNLRPGDFAALRQAAS